MRVPRGWSGLGLFVLLAFALIVSLALGQAASSWLTWDQKIAVASGGASKGPWRMNRSKFLYVDDPTVAINNQGITGVAWADQSRFDIYFQIYEANGQRRFDVPVNVSASPRTFSWLPRMVIGAGDARDVYILWQEIVFSGGSHGGEVFFARSTDGGKSFSNPSNLSNSRAGDGKGRLTRRHWDNGSLDLAAGPKGHLYAAWTEYDGRLWFSRSTNGGNSFSVPARVAGGPGASPARGPSLAVAAKGTVYLAWTVGETTAADIHVATSRDAGRSFGAPRLVFKSGGHSDAPKIAVDSKETIHLVYAESPAGRFGRYHIRYARSKDGARTFEPPQKISSPQSETSESVGFPSLSLDGENNVYVLWEIFPDGRSHPRGLGLTTSRDRGQTFLAPLVIPGSADPDLGFSGSQQGLLMRKLAVSKTAAIAIVNSTFKRNENSHIWLFRGKAALN